MARAGRPAAPQAAPLHEPGGRRFCVSATLPAIETSRQTSHFPIIPGDRPRAGRRPRRCLYCGDGVASPRGKYCRPAHRTAAYRARNAPEPREGTCPSCGARVSVLELLRPKPAPALTGNVTVDLRAELGRRDGRRRRRRLILGAAAAAVLVASLAGTTAAGLLPAGAWPARTNSAAVAAP